MSISFIYLFIYLTIDYAISVLNVFILLSSNGLIMSRVDSSVFSIKILLQTELRLYEKSYPGSARLAESTRIFSTRVSLQPGSTSFI